MTVSSHLCNAAAAAAALQCALQWPSSSRPRKGWARKVWYVICAALLSSPSLRGDPSLGGQGVEAGVEKEPAVQLPSQRDAPAEPAWRGAASDPTQGEWVLLLHVSDGYMDFLHNFLAWYMKIEEWSVQHAIKVVVSSDAAAKEITSAYGALEIGVIVGSYFGKNPLGYNEKGFTSLVQQRPSLILEELLADRNVLYLDVDVVLLADPFPSLPLGYDIWTAMDHPHVHCTGVLAIAPSLRTIDFLADWKSAIHGTKENRKTIGNQEAFNLVVNAEENAHLVVFKLSKEQFPPGSAYFSEPAKVDRTKVLAVHNNFLVGHAAKKKRFADYGLWLAPGFEFVTGFAPNGRGGLTPESEDHKSSSKVAGGVGEGGGGAHSESGAEAKIQRHPEEAPVIIMYPAFPGRVIKLSIEERAQFPVQVSGVVAGCLYSLQWRLYGHDGEGYTVSFGAATGLFWKGVSCPASNLTVPTGSISFVGRAELEVYITDRFPGLSQDDAFLSAKRRIVEFWSRGCVCSLIWPVPRQGNGRDGGPGVSKRYGCDEPVWSLDKVSADGGSGRSDEVTLVTVASITRLPMVLTVSELWDGPISVALYARTPEEEAALLGLLQGALSGWLLPRAGGDLRIVLVSPCYTDDTGTRAYALPINILRHHAVAVAATDLVFYIDVDFLPSAGAASRIRASVAGMDLQSRVLVVPCFKPVAPAPADWPRLAAITHDDDGCTDETSAPKEPCHGIRVLASQVHLADLLEHVGHKRFVSPGLHHASTDYPRWLRGAAMEEGEWSQDKEAAEEGTTAMEATSISRHNSYPVSYTLGYEPYLVVNKTAWSGLNKQGLYDLRFREKGWDKAEFVYEVALLGNTFWTLHRVFLVHVSDEALASCPKVFGSRFCSISAQTAGGGWSHAGGGGGGGESSRFRFASFIQDLSRRARPGACDGDDLGPGVNEALEVHGSYLPASMESWCLIYPFQVMKGLHLEVIDRWLDEAYTALALQLEELRSKLASSCADVDPAPAAADSCGNRTLTGSDMVNDWITRSKDWKGFFDWWCVSVPALVGTVRQLGDNGLLIRADSRAWEGWKRKMPDTYRFCHFLEGMNGVGNLERGLLGGLRIQLTSGLRLAEFCVEMMDQERLWQCTVKTVIQDKDGNVVRELRRESVLLELVASESSSELLWQLARMELALADERRQRQAAEEALWQARRQLLAPPRQSPQKSQAVRRAALHPPVAANFTD